MFIIFFRSVVYFDQLLDARHTQNVVYCDQLLGARYTLIYLITIKVVLIIVSSIMIALEYELIIKDLVQFRFRNVPSKIVV